jgi:hypothetical protein
MLFLVTNTLPSVFKVKGIHSGYSKITYKDGLIWFGNLLGCKYFTQTSHPQILGSDKFGIFIVHKSYGVISTYSDGALFSVKNGSF